MLNSTEYEILTAHKNFNAEKRLFMLLLSDVAIIILINVKIPNNFWQFHIYEHDKFHVHDKSFITSGPALNRENHDLAHLKIRFCEKT